MQRRFLHDPLHGIARNLHLLVRGEHRHAVPNQAQVFSRHKQRPQAKESRAHLDVRDEFRIGDRVIQMMPRLFDKFRKHGAAFLRIRTVLEQVARMLESMATANFLGNKADLASRILDAVLHDVHDLQSKPKAHVELRKFSLAFLADKARVGREKFRQKLPDDARHIIAVFVQVSDFFQSEPA